MDSTASALEQARAALGAQRNAVVSGDATALEAAGQALEQALSRLVRSAVSPQHDENLRDLQREASLNAQLIQRAAAANQRGLQVFFESSATYGADGSGRLSAPTRKLHAV